MSIFIAGLGILSVMCALIYRRSSHPGCRDAQFNKFKRTYLFVYLLATATDWLQGPYIYALYDSYGISTHDIERLFVAGYGSSMVFGTIVGSIADKYGRRTNCLIYAFLYSFSCFTKHFNNFTVLLAGRLVGGIATSIICSNFESWLVCEHHKRGYDANLLPSIFAQAVIGNSLVAIVSGVVAQVSVDSLGYTAPFDLAICLLTVMSIVIMILWDENYGDSSARALHSFTNAMNTIRQDRKVLCLGIIQSLFEGSMYTFVLEWTPALTPSDLQYHSAANPDLVGHHALAAQTVDSDDVDLDGHRGAIPHGFIFAAFMVAIMTGSSLFRTLSRTMEVESFMRRLFDESAAVTVEAVSGVLLVRRCLRPLRCRRAQLVVRLVVASVASLSMLAFGVFLVIRLWRLLTRWKLQTLAGDRSLLTFGSTSNWGIGNAMFAFASTLAIARHTVLHSVDAPPPRLCFDARLQLRAAFASLADWPACSPNDLLQLMHAERRHEYAYAKYDSQLVRDLPRHRHVVLDRYLQSWRYFADVDAELRHLFGFDEGVERAAAAALSATVGADHDQRMHVIKVGLHVRRGDIAEQQSLRELGYVVADASYIQRAMDFMDSRLGVDNNTGLDGAGRRRVFVVCSNDMAWCVEHIAAHRLRHVQFLSTHDPAVDLAVLATCQHSIITVGTFGWWAAWLSNGTTVYYKDWPRRGSPLAWHVSHADYFPPHWIPL